MSSININDPNWRQKFTESRKRARESVTNQVDLSMDCDEEINRLRICNEELDTLRQQNEILRQNEEMVRNNLDKLSMIGDYKYEIQALQSRLKESNSQKESCLEKNILLQTLNKSLEDEISVLKSSQDRPRYRRGPPPGGPPQRPSPGPSPRPSYPTPPRPTYPSPPPTPTSSKRAPPVTLPNPMGKETRIGYMCVNPYERDGVTNAMRIKSCAPTTGPKELFDNVREIPGGKFIGEQQCINSCYFDSKATPDS